MSIEPQTLPINGSMTTNILAPQGQNSCNPLISLRETWAVRVAWTVAGDAVLMMAPTAQWQVNVSLKSQGSGGEVPIGYHNELVGMPAAMHTYNCVIPIPGGVLGIKPGEYKLVTVLTLDNGGLSVPIAAYVEGPVIRFGKF